MKDKLLNKEIILLGHTRLTATGKKKDFHPALSKNKKVAIVHNGVVKHSQFNHSTNDTYQWADMFTRRGLDAITCVETAGTVAAILFLDYDRLLITKVGALPLYRLNTKMGVLYSSNRILNGMFVGTGTYEITEKIKTYCFTPKLIRSKKYPFNSPIYRDNYYYLTYDLEEDEVREKNWVYDDDMF